MLSQFTKEAPHHITLADLAFNFPKAVYPVGRLDADSEGLLLLTDDKQLNAKLLHPKNKQPKTYWVQVEGIPSESEIEPLREGIELKDGMTKPAKVKRIKEPANLWDRDPPVRERKTVLDSWLEITISEGRNRQVRRMTAAIGFPTLRLIRYRVGSWTIDGIDNGQKVSLKMDK